MNIELEDFLLWFVKKQPKFYEAQPDPDIEYTPSDIVHFYFPSDCSPKRYTRKQLINMYKKEQKGSRSE